MVRAATLSLLAVVLPACGSESPTPEAEANQDGGAGRLGAQDHSEVADVPAGNVYGFATWHADFPLTPHLSPRRPGQWYDRTSRQAIEEVVENLQGNCTRDAWTLAKRFFYGAGPEAIETAIDRLDVALQVEAEIDLVHNLVQALGRAEDPLAADALVRALEHPKETIRNEAMQSLVTSGTADSVRRARLLLDRFDGRGIVAWVQAARRHLPEEEVIAAFRAMLDDARYGGLHARVVAVALELSDSAALAVLERFIGHEPMALKATIAGLRHAVGDTAGTATLLDLLRHDAPQHRLDAIHALQRGDKLPFRDMLLRATADPDPRVRLAAVQALADIPGNNVDLTIENLVIDEAQDVRRTALAVLRDRGRRAQLDELIEIVRTGSGSKVMLAMEDLIAVSDGAAVPAMVERMQAAPFAERASYLRAIALTQTIEAFAPLRDAFLSPEGGRPMPLADIAYYMTNLRGSERALLQLFEELPTADYVRRAMLLRTLANVAADREQDEEFGRMVYARCRAIVADREELPQMRLLALEYLRRDLRIEDAMRLKELARDEEPPMHDALTDFLFEFF